MVSKGVARLKAGVNEKRKAYRLNMPLKLEYKLLPKQRVLKEVFLEDLSGTGLRVSLDYPLKKGDRLKTFLYFPEDPKPVTAFSRVIWCRKKAYEGERMFDVGIKHIKINNKDRERLAFLFCEMMLNCFVLGKPVNLNR